MDLKTRFTDGSNSRSLDGDWMCLLSRNFVKTRFILTVYGVLVCAGLNVFVLWQNTCE